MMMQSTSAKAVTLAVAGLTLFGCADTDGRQLPPSDVQLTASELIGGVEANAPELDAVGMLVVSNSIVNCVTGERITQDRPVCTASLIGERTVLTAKHCIDALRRAGPNSQAFFKLGPDSARSVRKVEIIDMEGSPVDQGGFVELGRDVAVVQLATPVLDVRPLGIAPLTPAAIGTRFTAIGFGIQDNGGTSGTRRAGSVTVNALEGRVFELIFGSFEAYREWYLAKNSFSSGESIEDEETEDTEISAIDAGPRPTPIVIDGGPVPPLPRLDGGQPDGGPNSLETYLRAEYENTRLLPGYEAYVGNRPGDAQLCRGDSGSPLVQMIDGAMVAYGVVSGGIDSRELVCDYGGVYASFGPETIDFLNRALRYTDPCNGVSSRGTCTGSVATRCTESDEGKRRITATDCAPLGQTCAVASNGNAVCATPGAPPVVLPVPGCASYPLRDAGIPRIDDEGDDETSGALDLVR